MSDSESHATEAPTEVPTLVPSEEEWLGEEEPTLVLPTAGLADSLSGGLDGEDVLPDASHASFEDPRAPLASADPSSGSASGAGLVPGALAKEQRLLLDRAYRYLVEQGFGPLELSSLDLAESSDMALQLARELNVPFEDWLQEAVF